MATNTTRLGIRRVQGTDLFKPYTVDLPSIVDTIDAKAVQFASALASVQVRDVGEVAQIRAGRVLAPADFTAMGLATPLGLWNLSNVNDASGAGRTLTNKGAVPFGPGIMGAATEAAVFAGSTAQALYIADTGAADPFRIKMGSWGCWFRTAKRGTGQYLLTKQGALATTSSFGINVTSTNVVQPYISDGATAPAGSLSTTDIVDDRWHHVVCTHDGTRLRMYLDAALETQFAAAFLLNAAATAPLNVGSFGADASTNAGGPHYGRVDEAFVTADVLSPEQVLNLYCARVPHALVNGAAVAVAPNGARLGVRRRKRGGPLATTDFPSTPVRLHNFTAGALTDQGTGGVTLAPVGGGSIVSVSGPDGTRDGAQSFSGAHTGLASTDTGLPSGLAARSYGAWFKTAAAVLGGIVSWGTAGTNDARIDVTAAGIVRAVSGPDAISGTGVADGLWHSAIVVEDSAAADGLKRKLYLDGRLVVGSTVLTSLTPAGANHFRVGAAADGSLPFTGQIDGAFVSAVALTDVQVRALYNVGSQALAASPKAEGDHVESLEASGVLAHMDTLEGCDLVDLSVVG